MENNKNIKYEINIIIMIILYSISLIIFLCFNKISSNKIENNINNSITNFIKTTSILVSNNNEILKNITYDNKAFDGDLNINNYLDSFNKSLEGNYDLLINSINSTINNDINSIGYWLSFLSLIFIIFTILGIYANNKILQSTKYEADSIIGNIDKKINSFNTKIKYYEEKDIKYKIEKLNLDAIILEKDGNLASALEKYKTILEIDNNNFMALNNLLVIFAELYDIHSDIKYLYEALNYKDKINYDKLTKENIDSILTNIVNLFSSHYKNTDDINFFYKAIEYLEQINDKTSISYYVAKANIYHHHYNNTKSINDFTIACDIYKNILKNYSNNFAAISNIAALYSDKYYLEEKDDDFRKSLEYYYMALSLENKLFIRYNIANLLKSYGYKNDLCHYTEQAENIYNSILKEDPFNIDSIIGLGCIYADNYTKTNDNNYFYMALEKYDFALLLSKNNYNILEYKLKIYDRKCYLEPDNIGDSMILLEILNEIIYNNDKNLNVIEIRAKIYFRLYTNTKNIIYYNKFILDYNRAIELNSQDLDLKYYISLIYLNKYIQSHNNNDYDIAEKQLSEFIDKTNKTNLYSIMQRGILYSEKYKCSNNRNYLNLSMDDYNDAYERCDKNNKEICYNIQYNRGLAYFNAFLITKEEEFGRLFLSDFDAIEQNNYVVDLKNKYRTILNDMIKENN